MSNGYNNVWSKHVDKAMEAIRAMTNKNLRMLTKETLFGLKGKMYKKHTKTLPKPMKSYGREQNGKSKNHPKAGLYYCNLMTKC